MPSTHRPRHPLAALTALVALTALSALGSPALAAPKVEGSFDKTAMRVLFSAKEGELVEAIANAPGTTVFPVDGVTRYGKAILKANELVLQPGSTLEFTDLGAEQHIIIVGKLKLARHPERAPVYTIRRAAPPAAKAPAGKPARAAAGASPTGHLHGRHGIPGGAGATGAAGQVGATPHMPSRLVLIVGSVEIQPGEARPVRLQFVLPGADGGPGGTGGDGGNGGNGYAGKGGDSTVLRCNHQPGNGGDGGRGGTGGVGGRGGAGGAGADVLILGPPEARDLLAYSTFQVTPGKPGAGGPGGNPGAGGRGGRPGHRRGLCTHRPGAGRNAPAGGRGAAGARGAPGRDGEVLMRGIRSVDPMLLPQ